MAAQTGTPPLTTTEAGDTPAGIRRSGPALGDDPLALAEALTAWANEQGGHDNITVTLARIVPASAEAAQPTASTTGEP